MAFCNLPVIFLHPLCELSTFRPIVSMTFLKLIARKPLIPFLFLLFINVSAGAQDGKQIFSSNCASCHAIDKVLSAPALRDVETRGPWTERANLHKWVKNPGAFIPTTQYTKDLQAQFGQIMPSFPQLSSEEVDAIFDYIASAPAPGAAGGAIINKKNRR